MKKTLSFILIMAVLCTVGCKQGAEPEGAPFYYCVENPAYSQGSTSIDKEYRQDIPTHSLMDTLKVYIAGPKSTELVSPFPQGLQILSATVENRVVLLTFSMELTTLTGLDLTLACSCLTLTCLALTDAEQVQISSIYGLLDGQRTITMDKNTVLLLDDSYAGN